MPTRPQSDRPASVLHKMLGIKDDEPPLTPEEFERYVRFWNGRRYAPPSVLESMPPCPDQATRKTRGAIRSLLADPRFDRALDLMKQSEADHAQREVMARERALENKVQEVDAFHENQLNELKFQFAQLGDIIDGRAVSDAALQMTQQSYSERKKSMRQMNQTLSQGGHVLLGVAAGWENELRDRGNAQGTISKLSRVSMSRSLVTMTDMERATLRMADVLVALDLMSEKKRKQIAVPIVWNDGNCKINFGGQDTDFRLRSAMLETLKPLMATSVGTSSSARELLNDAVREVLSTADTKPPFIKASIEKYLFSGNHWMPGANGTTALAPAGDTPTALRLGRFADGDSELLFDLRESLITVAPPGAGKSQAHVLRNLLYMNAPAVVLDVKGEMLANSGSWRTANVGKIYAFTPHDPDSSICFNPVERIRTDPKYAWDDARRLADLLVIPSAVKDGGDYFEGRARDMITTALLDVALDEEGPNRNMAKVLDRIYLSEEDDIQEWCNHLESLDSVPLARQASALKGMPSRQRESVFDSARRQLEIWQSPAIQKISESSTFDPGQLRAENATLYLSVALEDIKKYASVLRVLIGQTMAELYRVKPESAALPVTFFLDELPRLGRMDVIEEALDAGRGYGVRLWMFTQNTGQLRTAYPNSEGMMSNCAVRCFMNPDEDTARWISENLGSRQGLLDGKRKPLVEPHQLTGPEFAKQIVVFSRGNPPARLIKTPPYEDPECQSRMAHAASAHTLRAFEPEAPPPPRTETVSEERPSNWSDLEKSVGQAAEAGPAAPASWDDFVRESGITPARSAPVPAPKRALSFSPAIALLAVTVLGVSAWAISLHVESKKLLEETQKLTASNTDYSGRLSQAVQERNSMGSRIRNLEDSVGTLRRTVSSLTDERDNERGEHAKTRERLAALESQQRAAPQPEPTKEPPWDATPVGTVNRAQPDATPVDTANRTQPLAQPSAPPVTDCDTLAANPRDIHRVAAGVRFGELRLNARAAIDACEKALEIAPTEARFHYQKARALHSIGDPRARAIFEQLVEIEYPAAFDNAGQLAIDQNRTFEAAGLYRRGAALGDPDSMVSLAEMIRTGRHQARFRGEDDLLYDTASNLGHQGAVQDVIRRNAQSQAARATLEFFKRLFVR